MGDFDYYEFRGVLTPGAALVTGAALLYPNIPLLTRGEEFGLGELGAFVIISYVAGHLIAAVGNVFEALYWSLMGGWPTDQARERESTLLAGSQRERVRDALRTHLGIDVGTIEAEGEAAWRGHTRAMYAYLDKAGRTRRIDAFNSNYGLFRGLSVSLAIVAILTFIMRGLDAWPLLALLGAGVVLSGARMHRFASYYARELYAQFIQQETAT